VVAVRQVWAMHLGALHRVVAVRQLGALHRVGAARQVAVQAVVVVVPETVSLGLQLLVVHHLATVVLSGAGAAS
jgi:hypothetical protein